MYPGKTLIYSQFQQPPLKGIAVNLSKSYRLKACYMAVEGTELGFWKRFLD